MRGSNAASVATAFSLLLFVAAAWTQVAPTSPYQMGSPSRDGIGKYYYHREIAQIMGFEGASWLDRAEREREERPDLLVKELHLAPGMAVADIGAGSGYLAKRMAPLVSPGKVLAVDVQPEMVDLLRKLAMQPGMGNIVPSQGLADNVRLPSESIDLAVMVDVYHELSYPYEVVRSIIAALKPDGRMVFVEYRGEDSKVPIKELHKMTVAQIRLEMAQFPLMLERTDERLPMQHIVVFRKH
jgi:ubiquinone/menaquinone biosynthesis C-methylase UbiE